MIREKFKAFQKQNTAEKLNAVSFFLFCLVAIDCALTGGGHWLMAGPFSFRMILCFLAAAAAAPSMICDIRKWYKDPAMVSLLLFAVYLAVCAFVGLDKGNRNDLLLSDIKGFAWLVLVPIAAAVINKRERLILLMRSLAVAAAVQALFILIFNAVFVSDNRVYHIFYNTWMDIQLATVDHISDTTYRFFFNSAPYMVIGILCMAFFQVRAKKFRFIYAAGTGLCLTALMMTFTRSIYGAASISLAAALILFFICCPDQRKRIIGLVIAAAAVLALLTISQNIFLGCNTARFALARTFHIKIPGVQDNAELRTDATQRTDTDADVSGENMQETDDSTGANENEAQQVFHMQQQHEYIEDTQNSDDIRRETLQELQDMIIKSPVFGNGLGAAIASREGGRVEYFYQDLINKTGFFGLLLYCFPVGFIIFTMVRKWRKNDAGQRLINIVWIGGICVFLIATYFNPYMNSSLGICCYSIAIACFRLNNT